MAGDRLSKLAEVAAHHLDRIRECFIDPKRMRLTLLIRNPSDPSGGRDILYSDDDLVAVLAALGQMHCPADPDGHAGVERDNEITCSGCGASWTAAQGWGTP